MLLRELGAGQHQRCLSSVCVLPFNQGGRIALLPLLGSAARQRLYFVCHFLSETRFLEFRIYDVRMLKQFFALVRGRAYETAGADHIVYDLRFRYADWYEQIELLGREVLPALRA